MKTIKTTEETKKSNGLGVAGFVCSLVGLVFPYGIVSIVGLILSHVAYKDNKEGINTAGIVLGWIGLAEHILLWLFFYLPIMALGFAY